MTTEFDKIRPYNDGEIKGALNDLLKDRHFNKMMNGLAPWLPTFLRNGLFRLAFVGVTKPLDFQVRFMKPVVNYVLGKSAKGVTSHFDRLDRQGSYTFISNHRDIVLDAAILDLQLYKHKFRTTCEIAIGDNLLIYPWIKILVRMNKAFIVLRSLKGKEAMEGNILRSRYMHYAIQQKHENIWIAQREGRAKDSSDNTQYSLLRMLALAGEEKSNTRESLREMNLVPLTICYEYDPCDYLKATEMQCKRDNPEWKKGKNDDLLNMKTGILGRKGRITYVADEKIDALLDQMPEGQLSKEDYIELAAKIDQKIHAHYTLYPGNYVAYEMLYQDGKYADRYTEKEKKTFQDYLEGQLKKVDLPNPDWDFLRTCILNMYANPVINRSKANPQ